MIFLMNFIGNSSIVYNPQNEAFRKNKTKRSIS